ncbi:MAG: hydantoinase/oxoprolinase family protein, partial [Mycobacterium sp.]|nr:hydantoinase/oxoprolinase family protein [Mycobacterium sp.]
MAYRIGIDIGGTFTDLVVYDDVSGHVHPFKSLSRPDPVDCLRTGLTKAAEQLDTNLRGLLGQVQPVFCFGSTIGVNTLVTASGSRVGILTTRGHGDAYHMFQKERLGHVDLRDAVEQVFKPLVSRRHVAEVNERVDCFGNVVVPLNEGELASAVDRLVNEEAVEAIVVSFLWSHRRPEHELRAREIIAERHPNVFVSVGSELVGAPGEFQRVATAVINAYIGRRVEQQAQRVSDFLRENGLRAPILVMQNLGGLAPLEDIMSRPAYLLKSGPAGGVAGGTKIAAAVQEPNIVGIDMGGTSLDVSLIKDGEVELSGGFRMLAHPIAIPGVEIESIGAGGGSIASVKGAGGILSLKVGPESAGSNPGPACYGLGGELPTVTDADLLLGIIDSQASLGGEIAVDIERARGAIDKHVASPLGLSTLDAAWGIYQVVNAQMADALEHFLVKRGLAPSHFSVMVFGAAGAMHASAIARRLGIGRTIVPDLFPVLSAAGLMTSDIRYVGRIADDGLRMPPGASAEDRELFASHVSAKLSETSQAPLALLDPDDNDSSGHRLTMTLGLRFAGQALDLAVDVRPDVLERPLQGPELSKLISEWTRRYARIYGEGAAWSEGTVEVAHYTA